MESIRIKQDKLIEKIKPSIQLYEDFFFKTFEHDESKGYEDIVESILTNASEESDLHYKISLEIINHHISIYETVSSGLRRYREMKSLFNTWLIKIRLSKKYGENVKDLSILCNKSVTFDEDDTDNEIGINWINENDKDKIVQIFIKEVDETGNKTYFKIRRSNVSMTACLVIMCEYIEPKLNKEESI